jgi:hypothetical protein
LDVEDMRVRLLEAMRRLFVLVLLAALCVAFICASWPQPRGRNTMLKRMPRIAGLANMADLMASDYAGAMTIAIANVTCGDAVD